MRYSNECELGDLNNMENEPENMNVKLDFDFCDYYLCHGQRYPTPHPPRAHIILLVVIIIFGILLKCVVVNEVNENEKENEIGLKLELEFENINVNVNTDCNGYEYPTLASHCLPLFEFTYSRVGSHEQLVFNYLNAVNDNGVGFVYDKNENVKIEKYEYDFDDSFKGMIMVYLNLHVHVLLLIGTAEFNRIDTDVAAIDILVNIFGVVCDEYDIVNKISFGMCHILFFFYPCAKSSAVVFSLPPVHVVWEILCFTFCFCLQERRHGFKIKRNEYKNPRIK